MDAAIIIPPNEFRDETLSEIIIILNKWGVKPHIASYTSSVCTGYHGARFHPDLKADALNAHDFDALIIIDGPGFDQYQLNKYRPLFETIKEFAAKQKVVMGIGNAVEAIAKSNIIKNVKIAYPESKNVADAVSLYSGVITRNRVEADKNVITATSYANTAEAVNRLLIALGAK